MHYMNQSATEQVENSRREQRKRQTRTSLIRLARKFTMERGLNGFTLEELCEAANISRRTFFNHFATKDDAVLGFVKVSPFKAHTTQFMTNRDTIPLSNALIEMLSASMVDATGDIAPEVLMRLIHHEPSLTNRLRANGFNAVSDVERLICERENLDYPNAYAHTVSFMLHHMTMFALNEGNSPEQPATPETFRARLTEQLGHLTTFVTGQKGNTEPPKPTPAHSTPQAELPDASGSS